MGKKTTKNKTSKVESGCDDLCTDTLRTDIRTEETNGEAEHRCVVISKRVGNRERKTWQLY